MSRKILIALTIILIVVNTYIISYYSVESRRVVRLVAILSYLLFYLIFKGFSKNKIVFAVLLSFLISDILGFYFETPIVGKLIYIVRMIGYFLLIASVVKKVKVVKVKPHILLVFSIIIMLNVYLLFTLVESATKNNDDIFEYILILLYGATVVVVIFISTNYNLRHNSWRSTYFFYSILAIVFSDLSWFCAYFLKYTVLFYTDIIFYFLGLFCIINYAINTKENEDVLLTEEEL